MKKKTRLSLLVVLATLGVGFLFTKEVSSMEKGENFFSHMQGQYFSREDHQRMHEDMHRNGPRHYEKQRGMMRDSNNKMPCHTEDNY